MKSRSCWLSSVRSRRTTSAILLANGSPQASSYCRSPVKLGISSGMNANSPSSMTSCQFGAESFNATNAITQPSRIAGQRRTTELPRSRYIFGRLQYSDGRSRHFRLSGVVGRRGRDELFGVTEALPASERCFRTANIRSANLSCRDFERIPVDVCSLNQLLRKGFRHVMDESECLRQVDSDGRNVRDGDRTLTEV